ncbi:MAG: type II/IV secretion system protein [Pseudomonadota bacterium]
MDTRRLGEILLDRGLISEHDLVAALMLQEQTGELLGLLLVRMGALAEVDLLPVVAAQLDLPIQAAGDGPEPGQVAAFLAELRSPAGWWIDRHAAAWRTDDGAVICAAAHPLDGALRDRLAGVGAPVDYRLASRAAVAGFLEDVAPNTLPDGLALRGGGDDVARIREMAQEAPVIDFVNGIFSDALARRASDLHLEPYEDHFVVRMRIDGLLVTVRQAPRARFDAVCSRIKLLSAMDIGERRLPQDGRQSIRVAGRELDLRVSTLPSAWGESLVLRLLGKSDRLPELAELGLGAEQAGELTALVERPNGIVLLTGPTGSGKTTTIYRLLTHLNTGARKIITVEDPIEFDLPGVVQMQARPDIGLSFAAGLRAMLRQDPDVIMVGEIRDPQTARIAVQAALTGHLVIATAHTNSAVAAVARLTDLGVEAFLLADVLQGLVGQRLGRRLCDCATPSSPAQVARYEAARPATLRTLPKKAGWREPCGCPRCGGSGYLGRVGLFEIARFDGELSSAVRRHAGEGEIEAVARKAGFASLAEDGFAKARAGQTTLAEVARVLGGDDALRADVDAPVETAAG